MFRDIFPIEHNDRIALEYISYELGHWSCTCGQVTGLLNRYRWSCSSCKKSGIDRLDSEDTCPSCCKKHAASYVLCKKCLARVVVTLDMTADECRYGGKTYSMPLRLKCN